MNNFAEGYIIMNVLLKKGYLIAKQNLPLEQKLVLAEKRIYEF